MGTELMIYLILFVTTIFILFLLGKREQKKQTREQEKESEKLKELNEFFKAYVKNYVNSFENRDEDWKYLYDSSIKKYVSKEKDERLAKLPDLMNRYEAAFANLVSISEKNSIFVSSSEEEDDCFARMSYLEKDQKISNDIVNSIPALIPFLNIQKEFIIDLYFDYTEQITMRYLVLWRGLTCGNDDNPSYLQKAFESACNVADEFYNVMVKEGGWKELITQNSSYNTLENKQLYYTICDEDSESRTKWVGMWHDKLESYARRDIYSKASAEIYRFSENLQAKYNNPEWASGLFTNSLGWFGVCTSFNIDPRTYTGADLIRIRDLYLSGKKKGRFSKYADPEYGNK